jgi:CRP-like cAMP-binding protein
MACNVFVIKEGATMDLKLDMLSTERDAVMFAAGETIFGQGQVTEAMYVVLEGEVTINIDGKEVDTLGPGDPLGELALVDKSPRMVTAVAKGPARLAVINEKRFLYLVQETPYFALQVMRVMADRMRKMYELRERHAMVQG